MAGTRGPPLTGRYTSSLTELQASIGTYLQVNKFAHMTAAAVVITAGLGLAGLGVASNAHAQFAQFGPVPDYHWCPGEFWHPEWGFNWDWGNCHDDHHRDRDGGDHSNDWH
jgi:hypothetical protein